ncbi:MAG: gliding motility-associated ABC transporter substrate-binding protein GldG [Bacteroidetes bacterium]|nr:gliding motility-associated ABC transporter substrate-binding protein GldG [Bacteroidota bacterium]
MKKLFASKYWWFFLLILLVGINFLASVFHSRFDLTKEKRYTLSNASKQLLSNLDAPVTIDVFLKGDFPAGFKKLANSVQEFLQEYEEYGKGYVHFRFIDPFKKANDSAEIFLKETRSLILRDSAQIIRDTSGSLISQARIAILNSHSENTDKQIVQEYALTLLDSLVRGYGISPFTLQAPGKVGDEQVEKKVIPGALVHYKDTTIGINLLKGQKSYGTSPEELASLYNDVEATLEYKFSSAIEKITAKQKPFIGYVLGNGEAWGPQVDDAVRTLIRNYRFDTVNLKTLPFIPSELNALVILKPTIPFTDADKFKIDQYVMRGGKLFWMVDNMYAELDSLAKSGGFIAFDRALNLEDILFRYGVRLNQNLLEDMQCDKLPQIGNDPNSQQAPRLVDWPYFPILNGTDNPISKNLDGVRAIFPNTLDTVKVDGIKKTFLLRSSVNARVLQVPARIDFEYLQIAPDIKQFSIRDTTVAALLEGKFKSLFAGRVPATLADSMKAYGVPVKNACDTATKMIVVADGDIATNFISQQYGPLPMGFNLYSGYTFANKEFFSNAIDYLVNPSHILETRAKDFTLRLLNPRKVKEQKPLWQFVNIALPVILVIIIALIYQQARRKRYAS